MVNSSERFRAITAELKSMVEADQAMRNGDQWDETVDHQNTKRMKVIVEEIGWPTISKVGYPGSSSAWLLVQHADHDSEFQKKCLTIMKAEPENEVPKDHIAYLEDRIAVGDGRLQIYGTQFHTNADGQLQPLPICDPEGVDQRRKEMWLEPLSNNQKRIQESYDRNSA